MLGGSDSLAADPAFRRGLGKLHDARSRMGLGGRPGELLSWWVFGGLKQGRADVIFERPAGLGERRSHKDSEFLHNLQSSDMGCGINSMINAELCKSAAAYHSFPPCELHPTSLVNR